MSGLLSGKGGEGGMSRNRDVLRYVTRVFLGQGSFLGLGHFDKHSPAAQERKAPQGINRLVFCLETLKSFILNDKCYLKMTTIRAFFLQIRALFSNFQKRAGETSPPCPLLVMHLVLRSFYLRSNSSLLLGGALRLLHLRSSSS